MVRRQLLRSFAYARATRAAATMFSIAAVTSGHLRVFRPQSGLTQSWSAGSRARPLSAAPPFHRPPARAGEWMSYTPGPISVGIAIFREGIQQLHLRARGLDRDHIGIHRADRRR